MLKDISAFKDVSRALLGHEQVYSCLSLETSALQLFSDPTWCEKGFPVNHWVWLLLALGLLFKEATKWPLSVGPKKAVNSRLYLFDGLVIWTQVVIFKSSDFTTV